MEYIFFKLSDRYYEDGMMNESELLPNKRIQTQFNMKKEWPVTTPTAKKWRLN